jgi:hypothetical protein
MYDIYIRMKAEGAGQLRWTSKFPSWTSTGFPAGRRKRTHKPAELKLILQLGKVPAAVAEVNAEIFRSFGCLERSFKTPLCVDRV